MNHPRSQRLILLLEESVNKPGQPGLPRKFPPGLLACQRLHIHTRPRSSITRFEADFLNAQTNYFTNTSHSST